MASALVLLLMVASILCQLLSATAMPVMMPMLLLPRFSSVRAWLTNDRVHSLLAPFSISRAYVTMSVWAFIHKEMVCCVHPFRLLLLGTRMKLELPFKLAAPSISPAAAELPFNAVALLPLLVESLADSTVPLGRCQTAS